MSRLIFSIVQAVVWLVRRTRRSSVILAIYQSNFEFARHLEGSMACHCNTELEALATTIAA